MSHISIADVKKVAVLSALALSDDQLKKFQVQFQEIIDYVEQLNDVDVNGLEPTYQVTGLKNVTRPDVVIDYGVSQAELLKNAPATLDNSIKVRKVL